MGQLWRAWADLADAHVQRLGRHGVSRARIGSSGAIGGRTLAKRETEEGERPSSLPDEAIITMAANEAGLHRAA